MKPPAALFGMSYGRITEGVYPESTGIGSMRLWDNGVTWSNLNPSPGVWNWDGLD